MTKNWRKIQIKQFIISKIAIYWCPSYGTGEDFIAQKRTSSTSENVPGNLLNFLCLWVIFAVQDPDPDPDPGFPWIWIQCRYGSTALVKIKQKGIAPWCPQWRAAGRTRSPPVLSGLCQRGTPASSLAAAIYTCDHSCSFKSIMYNVRIRIQHFLNSLDQDPASATRFQGSKCHILKKSVELSLIYFPY